MAKSIREYVKKLPKKRREKIHARAKQLVAEEATLQELRKALEHSQVMVAKRLKVNQAAISKIENRTDMYISTLRSFIEAMGGSLNIIAQFPGRSPIRISQFEDA